MWRMRLSLVLALVPAVALFTTLAGCNKEPAKEAAKNDADKDKDRDKDKTKPKTTGPAAELASTGWGSLKGKVKFEGAAPPAPEIKIPDDNKDKAYCLMGNPEEKQDPEALKVHDGGVEYVVVWLRAPKGKYFKIPDGQKKRTDTPAIDQPHCAFTPHSVVLFPSYYDGKKQEPTGQKFEIKNSAKITHNTNWDFSNKLLNTGDNKIIPPSDKIPVKVLVSKEKEVGREEQMTLKCNIHPWMKGYAWAFDHPFAAVTDKDGNFEIKEVPAGAEVELVYWHEEIKQPKVAEKVTFKEGANTKDIVFKK